MRPPVLPGLALIVLAMVGCGSGSANPDTPVEPGAGPSTPRTSAAAAASSPPSAPAHVGGDSLRGEADGTVVRFSGGGVVVDVTIGADTPTTRDLVSLLPFTMQLEDFAGREKIGDPPRELDVGGTPGSDPEDGDLIYFTPWGNLGFSYDASGIDHSDSTPHLGTCEASEAQLSRLEGQQIGEITITVLTGEPRGFVLAEQRQDFTAVPAVAG